MKRVFNLCLLINIFIIQLSFGQIYDDCLLIEIHHSGEIYREFLYNDEFRIDRIYTFKADKNHYTPYFIDFEYNEKGQLIHLEYTDKQTKDIFKVVDKFYVEDKLMQQKIEYRHYAHNDIDRKPIQQYHRKISYKQEQLTSFEYDAKGQLLSATTQCSEKNQNGTHFIFEKGLGWEMVKKRDLLWESKKIFFSNKEENAIKIEFQEDESDLISTDIIYENHLDMIWQEYLHYEHEFNPIYVENHYANGRYEKIDIENIYDNYGKLIEMYVEGISNFSSTPNLKEYKLESEERTFIKYSNQYIYYCN